MHIDQAGKGGAIDGVMVGRWALQRPLDMWFVDEEPYIKPRGTYHSDDAHRPTPSINAARNSMSEFESTPIYPSMRRYSNRADAISAYGVYALSELRDGSSHAVLSEVLLPLILVTGQLAEDSEHLYEVGHVKNVDIIHALDGAHAMEQPVDQTTDTNAGAMRLTLNEFRDIYSAVLDAAARILEYSCPNFYIDNADYIDNASPGDVPSVRKLQNLFSKAIGKKVANKIKRNRSELLVR
jgi:hypothetical protein